VSFVFSFDYHSPPLTKSTTEEVSSGNSEKTNRRQTKGAARIADVQRTNNSVTEQNPGQEDYSDHDRPDGRVQKQAPS
jgi:hypothetical protein